MMISSGIAKHRRGSRTRRPARAALAALAALILLGAAGPARAGDKAAAEQLFKLGRDLMDEGKLDEACPKFAESFKADPSVGAKLNLARCYEMQGKTASAWVEYSEAAALARDEGDAKRAAAAKELASKLEAKLSRLTITVAEPVPGLSVTRDGAEIGAPSYGVAIPVDPGEHAVRAAAPGHRPWSTLVTVGPDADRRTVAVPTLEKGEGEEPAGKPAPAGPAAGERVLGVKTVLGVVLTGVGVAGVGVGTVFGVMAIGNEKDLRTLCPGSVCQKPEAIDSHKKAQRNANISTAGIGVGAASAIAGIVLLIVGDRPEAERGADAAQSARIVPVLGPGGGGLSLSGSF
ncbi:MAG: hypothetical protein HY744_29380 [Deltaproteobacteria bacterium]|nr:hypothetical protein [Deltaproteobacteria bacterium]